MAQIFGQSAGLSPETETYVDNAIADLVNSAPAALDTLNELANALGGDENFATTVTNSIAAKAPIASPTFTGTVSGITKAMVGLGNVDNTSDANKPISTATQTALDLKADRTSPVFTSDVTLSNILAPTNDETVNVFGNLEYGILNVAHDLVNGEVNIASATATNGIKSVRIATGSSGEDATTNVVIGSSNGTVNAQGMVFLGGTGGWKYLDNALTYAGGTATPTLFENLTSGSVTIAGGTTFGGTVNIATGETSSGTKTINIGTGGITGSSTNITIGATGGTLNLLGHPTIEGVTASGATGTGLLVFSNSPTLTNLATNVIITPSATNTVGMHNNNTTGGIGIGTGLTTGNFNIANGTTYTGIVNIANGATTTGTRSIQIGNNGLAGSTTNIVIGSFAGTSETLLNGTNIANTIAATQTSSSALLYNNITSGSVSIANGSSFAGTVNIAGGATSTGTKAINLGTGGATGSTTNITIGSNSGISTTSLFGIVNSDGGIFTSSSSATPLLYSTVTTGSIGLGTGLSSGTLNVATGSSFAGTINMATSAISSGTKTINIGTGGANGSTTTVNISSNSSTSSIINLNGTTYVGGTFFVKSIENNNGNAVPISFFSTQTTGAVSIANGTAFAGTLNLAAGATTSGAKVINLGGNVTGTASSTINIGSSTGFASTIYLYGNVYGQAFYSRNVGSSVGLFTDNTTGGINLGGGLTSGNVSIANGSSFNGTVSIANGAISSGTKFVDIAGTALTGTATQEINIGTGTSPVSSTVTIGSSNGNSKIELKGSVRISPVSAPASATDTGLPGEIAWDNSFIYVCTDLNTWKRAALTTW